VAHPSLPAAGRESLRIELCGPWKAHFSSERQTEPHGFNLLASCEQILQRRGPGTDMRAAPLNGGSSGWNGEPRQVDGENASLIRHVARIDPAMIRFDSPSAESETKT
jgi:hypothetical protein